MGWVCSPQGYHSLGAGVFPLVDEAGPEPRAGQWVEKAEA